ncbi:hypothetical protein FA95DRAFT_1564357 [Auriscalpium vulgare]|uniref:Uncharacterized protein n=1 Tax=Auriscalpium vulgare TaxID=40419 RepID=A0ACB8RE82_9AGAM|nr:hypothetical protein FA95DRAFT_1564357 [Auriscalpium vulgare]
MDPSKDLLSPGFGPHPNAKVLGGFVFGLFVQCIETGVLLSQFFYGSEKRQGRLVKGLVLWVCLVACVQTVLQLCEIWSIFVMNMGLPSLYSVLWIVNLQPLFTTLMASPIQAFLLCRCWRIVRGNYFIIFPLIAVLLASAALNIAATVRLFSSNASAEGIWIPYLFSLILPACLDVSITTILFIFLVRSLRHVYAEHVRRVIYRLMLICWEAMLPPTLCATAILVMYTVWQIHHTAETWVPAVQGILGKLHVISLFFYLNGRIEIACTGSQDLPYRSTLTVPMDGMVWSAPRGIVRYPPVDMSQSTQSLSTHAAPPHILGTLPCPGQNTSIADDASSKACPRGDEVFEAAGNVGFGNVGVGEVVS